MKVVRRRKESARGPVIAVDTGLNGMGWAVWRSPAGICPPDRAGVVEVPSARMRDDWPLRATWTIAEFMGAVATSFTREATQVVEWPEFRSGDEVGIAAASRDSLSQLAFMVGMHKRIADCFGATTILAPVSEWKGQMPKRVVEQRIARAVGLRAADGSRIESHAVDATGIGLWLIGGRKRLTGKEYA